MIFHGFILLLSFVNVSYLAPLKLCHNSPENPSSLAPPSRCAFYSRATAADAVFSSSALRRRAAAAVAIDLKAPIAVRIANLIVANVVATAIAITIPFNRNNISAITPRIIPQQGSRSTVV